jgi:group I intron endonuclease
MHSTSNLKDGYIGSGTHLRRSIRKYGIDNFKLEILEWCNTRDELIEREKEIITENHINNPNCYNMKNGGLGGGKFYSKEHQFKCSQAAGLKHSERMKNDKSYRLNHSKKISEANKRRIARGETFFYYDWTGKKHKEETIQKMKESKRGHGIGKQNSQYGLKWITDGNTNQKIKKDEPLPENWKYGRISN